jgi:hypothetical protein
MLTITPFHSNANCSSFATLASEKNKHRYSAAWDIYNERRKDNIRYTTDTCSASSLSSDLAQERISEKSEVDLCVPYPLVSPSPKLTESSSENSFITPANQQIASIHQLPGEWPFKSQLASRLEHLDNVSKEDYPDQEPISPVSLADFLYFITSISNLNYPSVVLTHTGNVRSQWSPEPDKHFAIEFLGKSDVRYVIFAPDPSDSSKTSRVSGQTTVTNLLNVSSPFGVFSWILRESIKAA